MTRIDVPGHPGREIERWRKRHGITQQELADGLGVSRTNLSTLLNGRRGVSPEMAIRLQAAGCLSAGQWVRTQAEYDLYRVRRDFGELIVEEVSLHLPYWPIPERESSCNKNGANTTDSPPAPPAGEDLVESDH